MGRIQSSIGLVTGVPIEDTVNQLMRLNAIPRDRLVGKTADLQQEQVALTELTALVVGVQLSSDRLGQASLFSSTKVSSSNSQALSARSMGDPSPGTYTFIPVRQAQSQQLTSGLFASGDQKLSAGELVIRTGGFLDDSANLDQINDGSGFSRGRIRITDQGGNKQTIDLRFAQTASEVVDTINAQDGLGVVARIDGDRFVLRDISGGSTSDLIIEDLDGATTATDLGIAATTSDTTVIGRSVYNLHRTTALGSLRDGRGLDLIDDKESLKFKLRDGTSVSFTSQLSSNSASLGQLLDEINAAGNGKFEVNIALDGKSLEANDLTTGSHTFSINSPSGSLAEQLGFDAESAGSKVSGKRLIAGLGSVLLSSLGGGEGLDGLGEIRLTDRSGRTDTVDLSAAETLEDVIDAINGSSTDLKARLNRTKTGIEIIDGSGATASNLIIADGDGSNSATRLKIAVNKAVDAVDSASLNRQFITRNTRLDSLSGNDPFPLGSIRFTDSAGVESAVNLGTAKATTIGDVLDAINGLNVGVEARLNESGDGILIADTAGGTGALTIADVGTGQAAKQLRIAGTGSELDLASGTALGIDGSQTIRIKTTGDTSLADLAKQINELDDSPTNASLLSLGSGGGVRLLLTSAATGVAGRIAIESELGVSFSETSQGRDALLAFGANQTSGGVVVSSATNTFDGLVEDLEFTISDTSETPISVTVAETSESLTKQIDTFVGQFNRLRDKLADVTKFDATANAVGVLFGSNAALRVDLAYGRLFTSPVRGAGAIGSLAQLGIRLNDVGKLEFDQTKFDAALANDAGAVEEFFTNEDFGFSAKAKAVADSLASVETGALLNRSNALQNQIEQNERRVSAFNVRLDKQRTRLLTQFFNMETAIAKLQQNLTALGQLQIIPPLNSSSN